ncbi:hypothetical protein BGZ76_008323 [Entomortierella beljakovae]|nr:hypothetical protein BGZ76_008323 [Entomortierella beljakovae]
MALDEARLKDAVKFMHEAEKNTEKTWFKKPDWDIAAQYYEKAAQSFKAGKSYDQSVQAFIKTSDAMVKATSLFMAARALENGGNICIQNLGQPERAADMYKRASELFMQNMTPDRAAEMLEKGARAMEPISVDSALEFYTGACNIYENEDRAKYATDTYKKTIGLLVKNRRFEKAIDFLQRLGKIQSEAVNKSAYYKTLLSIVIIQLAAGDEVEAGKRFQESCGVDGFVRSEESAIAHAMLDAFEHRDQNYYNQAAARQHIGFLDNEIAKLARNIAISDDLISGGGYVDTSAPSGNGQFSQSGPGGPPRGPYSGNNSNPGGNFNNNGYQQPQQPPYGGNQSHPHQQHQGAPPPPPPQHQPNPYQQRPTPPNQGFNAAAAPPNQGYNASAARPDDDRNESDWRALTGGAPAAPAQAPHHQQYPPHQQNQQRQQQAGAPSGHNYYQGGDDDDLL